MPVGSYLELVLTTLGWHLYGNLWAIFVETGLVYLPIVFSIINNWIEPVESQDQKSAGQTSLKRLEIDILSKMIIIFMAVNPMVTLHYADPTFNQACGKGEVRQGNSGTTYDKVFGADTLNGDIVQVPLVFYATMSIAGGINAAFISSLPCDITVRQLRLNASVAQVQDIETRREIEWFVDECYGVARADYMFNNEERMNTEVAQDEWIGWIGNKRFMNNEYKDIHSMMPNKYFPFDPKTGSADAGHAVTEHGRPTCDVWWKKEEVGLKDRLLAQYPLSSMQQLKTIFTSTEEVEEAAVRKLLQNEKTQSESFDLTNNVNRASGRGVDLADMATGAVLGDVVAGGIEWAGGAVTATLINLIADYTIMTAPYVQAIALFSVYFLLPIAIVVGGFQLSTIKTAVVTIFAIKFWSSIWAVVAMLDDKLARALSVRDGLHPIDFISLNVGFDAIIINLVVVAMYISLPMMLMTFLTWGGERNANASSSVSGSTSAAGTSAGNKSSGVASSIGK